MSWNAMDMNAIFFAGELDIPPDCSFLEPKAHFDEPEIKDIYDACFGTTTRDRPVSDRIHKLTGLLKSPPKIKNCNLFVFKKTSS